MNRLLNTFLGVLVMISLGSCSRPTESDRVGTLGEEFSLALGGKIEIESENLSLYFLSVPDDFRCPTQVDCESEGQAIVVVEVVKGDGESEVLEFNTNPWPDTNRQIITELGYVFKLVRLDPYPEHPNNPIQPKDYRAILVVRKE